MMLISLNCSSTGYEWGGASGSIIGDHGASIDYFVQCAKEGVDFSTINSAELTNIHIRKFGATRVSLDKLHLFAPLLAALGQNVPQLVSLDAAAFEYRGLAEDFDKGTRISWVDGGIGVQFARDWPTAKEASWLAQYWKRAKWYFQAAVWEAAERGMHSTLYAVHNWGRLLTFCKPLTIAEDVRRAILRDATQNGEVDGDAEDGGDAIDDGSYDGIQPVDNLFRPIAIALTHHGFSVKCVDAATVDGLIPPSKPSKSEAVVAIDGTDARGTGAAVQPYDLRDAKTQETWLFEISWLPTSDFDVQERDMENYRFYLGTALDELQLADGLEDVEKDNGTSDCFGLEGPF
jgi:hypothetical protein